MSVRNVIFVLCCLAWAVFPAGAAAQGIDDPMNVEDWTSHWDCSADEFKRHMSELREGKRRPLDIEVYDVDGKQQFSGVWIPNDGRSWSCYWNMTSDEFSTRWEKYRAEGYRTVDIEVDNVGGELKFAAVWVENVEDAEVFCWWDMTEDDWDAKTREHTGQGFRLRDIEVYPVGEQFKFAAIWVKDGRTIPVRDHRHLTDAEFKQKFDTYLADGFRVSDIEVYDTSSGLRYSVIWTKNYNGRYWAALWGMTAEAHREQWKANREQNLRPVQIQAYATPEGTRYAAVYTDNRKR